MLSFLHRPLRCEDLIERARRSAGLDDFGDTPFQEGLRVFLDACTDEADLSLFGYFGTRWDVSRFLSNLLRLRHEETRTPEILAQPIERPLFIMGMPRSGTTFLQRLLTADENNRVPRVWELIHPYPPLNGARGRDRRQQRVARQLRMFELLSPEFSGMHPINANSPQECSEITAHVFASLRFDTTYSIPSYRSWLDRVGHLSAYRFHKRFLQHLQYQDRRPVRWVLKCPDHVFALDAMQTVYPDVRVVFVHRDPAHVLGSVTRLTEILRKPFTRHIDRAAIGRHEIGHWSAAARLLIRAANEEPFVEPIFHVQHRHLVSDPVGTVAALYRHFGLDLKAEAASRMARMLEEAPNGGYGNNRFSFEAYGIDPASVRDAFAPYTARFGVISETNCSVGKRPVTFGSLSQARGD